jgi:Domain of unknown function (DUF1929)/Concanavalin A-like lectin/glucanases superfamily
MADSVSAPEAAVTAVGTAGKWEVLPFHSEVLAVHAALLHTGKVLFAAGSGNSIVRFSSPDFGNTAKGIGTSVVWDPTVSPPPAQDTNFFHPETKRDVLGNVLDFFCGGETVLADGQVLTTGGTADYDHPDHGLAFAGRADTLLFDPTTEQWMVTRSMAHGRWYPSVITLGDGRGLAAAGLDEHAHGARNTSLESFFHHADYWQTLAMPTGFGGVPLYAHLYLLADGSVFYAGGHMDDAQGAPLRLDLTRSPATVSGVPGLSRIDARDQCASVLLPPAQDQKVMIIGGAPGEDADAIVNVDVIDFTDPNPTYHRVADMNVPRIHVNATLLPDRTVLITGGSEHRENKAQATNHAEIFDPAHPERGWTQLAEASVVRMYHSVALLLPDARVVTACGNPDRGTHVAWDAPDPNEEMRMEIFSPPYLDPALGSRPTIGDAPTEWRYGQTVTIVTADAATLRDVSLIRAGATTHSFNTSQRLVDLPIAGRAAVGVRVQVTDEPNIAPPGWYMLFITNTKGVPSVAKWVHLAGAPETAVPTDAYAAAVLDTPGLVAYWPLTETKGTVVYDVAGTHHGSYMNHPVLGASGPGQRPAVSFNGTDDYAFVPRDVRNDFSLEVWFRSSGGGVGTGNTQWWQGAGLLDGEVTGVRDDFGISLDASGQIWAGTGNPDTSIHSGSGFDDDAWHHVVFTRTQDAGELTLYVDGALAASATGGTQPMFAAPGLRLGVLQTGVNSYAGVLADAAMYDTALPAATVVSHFSVRGPTP